MIRIGGVPLQTSQRANGLSLGLSELTRDPEEQNVRGVHFMREEGQVSDSGGVGEIDKEVEKLMCDLRRGDSSAVRALEQLGTRAIPELVQALGDSVPPGKDEPSVPYLAGFILKKILQYDTSQVVQAVIRASLSDPNLAVQEGAARFLPEMSEYSARVRSNWLDRFIISELIKAGREKQNQA